MNNLETGEMHRSRNYMLTIFFDDLTWKDELTIMYNE